MDHLYPFSPADNPAAATWVANGLKRFATSAVSIVPAGFPAYARVYHPAWRTINGNRTPVRWSEDAKANHRVWWPDDRTWCVATEIDFMTTDVAGADEAIAALKSHLDLEVDVVEPLDDVTPASDTINPTVPEGSA